MFPGEKYVFPQTRSVVLPIALWSFTVEKLRYTDWDFLIDDLVGPKRSDGFPFERELLFYQFQTWIYIPGECEDLNSEKSYNLVDDAGIVAAAKFLERLGQKYLGATGLARNSSVQLVKCLNDPDYRSLYNTVLKRHGGWTALLYTPSARDIDDRLAERRKRSETVCEIIDYRFRCLDHGSADKRQANLSHGLYFRYTDSKQKLSGKTIRNRWSANRDSAIFLYVSERLGPCLFPPALGSKNFVDEITKRAVNRSEIKLFLSRCAYVGDVLNDAATRKRLAGIEPIRPTTNPLSQEELGRMSDYKDGIKVMRDN
jgi:hypothetical protein